MEESDKIGQLYSNYEILANAQDKIGEHEKEYREILSAVKGSSPEKRLASQIITRFYKYFPGLSSQAIDAQLDLCEDDDVAIRKQAIKDLPLLCRDNIDNLNKIADVLAQLLQTEDAGELNAVHNSLMTLFKIECKVSLQVLFYQIISGEEVIRDRAIKFLSSKLKTLPDEVLTKEVEECFLGECKKVLQDVTADEFNLFMNMMTSLKLARTLSGHQQIVKIVEDLCDLEKEFDASDTESVDRFVQCGHHLIPFFSSQIPSTNFVEYICSKVLPKAQDIHSTEDNVQLDMLKLLADMSTNTGTLNEPDSKIENIFNKLLEYMPLPPSDENAENTATNEVTNLQFTFVECLMYTFHQVGKRHPEWILSEDRSELLKDFKLRLQYFARSSQAYVKKLREALSGKRGEELKSDENKIKVVALKTTSNINVLIKDLFHNPPSYKSSIHLSWKPSTIATNATRNNSTAATTAIKRKTPITYTENSNKKLITGPKQDREIYQPPSGKYSDKVKGFTIGRGGGSNRRAGRGGFSYGYSRGRGGRGRGSWY